MAKPNHDITATGRMKRPRISVCTRVKNSWEAVEIEMIIKSFKNLD